MLPDEYKKELQEKLKREADRSKAEKESRLQALYNQTIQELQSKYKEAAEKFSASLKS